MRSQVVIQQQLADGCGKCLGPRQIAVIPLVGAGINEVQEAHEYSRVHFWMQPRNQCILQKYMSNFLAFGFEVGYLQNWWFRITFSLHEYIYIHINIPLRIFHGDPPIFSYTYLSAISLPNVPIHSTKSNVAIENPLCVWSCSHSYTNLWAMFHSKSITSPLFTNHIFFQVNHRFS